VTITLLQKHPLKGTREFSIVDDELHCSIKSPLKTEESMSFVFSALNPEPVISGSTVSFLSLVNQEPLVDFFLNRPDKESFDQFIKILKERIVEEDFGRPRVSDNTVNIDIARLDESINMLRQYIDPTEIELLLSAMTELKENPSDASYLNNVIKSFNDLGFVKAQVLTYAPYINFLLFGNKAH